MSLRVRSSGATPGLLTKSVAAVIGGVNPQLALTFRPLADQVNASLTQERLVAMLSEFLGALALLAGLGLYGVTANVSLAESGGEDQATRPRGATVIIN